MRLRHRYPRRLAAVGLLGLTLLAAVACSGSSSPPSAGDVPQTGTTAPSSSSAGASSASSSSAGASSEAGATTTSRCADAPSATVGKALGLAVGKLVATQEGPVTLCAYTGRYEVLVRYQTGENAAEFAQARNSQASLHQTVATVNGLGDGAYLASYTKSKPPSNTLGALKGDIAIFITSQASLSAERALMTGLLAKA